MKGNENFASYRSMLDERLYAFLAEQTKESYYSDDNSKYPSTLYDPLNYIMSGGGKRIRPIMMMLSCEAFGGKSESALDAAVAVEILHNFTLVHDDIMDNAATRRGIETIHKKWDLNAAILVGDDLIGLSYRSLIKTKSQQIAEIVKTFTDGIIQVCEGQALDKEFETMEEVTVGDYIIMITKKTSELLRMSAVIGALIAEASPQDIDIISEYSHNLGIAFQIQDDLLDVIGNEAEFGKKIGGDIDEKKKTFLYLKALETADGELRDRIKKYYKLDFDEKKNEFIKLYNSLYVIEAAKGEIKKYTFLANENLLKIKSNDLKKKLQAFSDMLLNRSH